MSGGYQDLRDIGVQFGPFDGEAPPHGGQRSPFDASWGSTVDLLARELRALDAAAVVIEIEWLTDSDLRNDGIPRASARLGDSVRISFNSRFGPLRYETGRFTRGWYSNSLDGWQANVRAIALGLEALRKVERYGITKRGEQYTGWKALPASTDPADAIQSLEQARIFLETFAPDGTVPASFPNSSLLKLAVKATHPDAGGDETEFRKVQRAREVLGV